MIKLSDVRRAAKKISGSVARTPLVSAHSIGNELGVKVYLKLENLQITHSFKPRGVFYKTDSLSPGAKVVSASTGNLAQALAYVSQQKGLRAYVVVPKSTPAVKVNGVKKYKAKIFLVDGVYDDALVLAEKLAAEKGMTLVSSREDEEMIAGQGTVCLELLEDNPDIDMIFAPIGSGGLIAGCGVVAKTLRPEIRLIGVQAQGAAAMKVSIDKGEVVQLKTVRTIADGIALKSPGEMTFRYVRRFVDSITLVSDEDIREAIKILFNQVKIVAEPAGAASLAGFIKMVKKRQIPRGKRVACIVSGGNIDEELLFKILHT